jgi:hypothetical protein
VTNYPINYTYSAHDGSLDDGFAATADEALAAIRAALIEGGADGGGLPTAARLTTTEAGSVQKRREDVERDWSAEIAAGWARVIQVYGGWKIEVETWGAL